MKYAMKKSGRVLLALAAIFVMQAATAESNAMVPRCRDSFAADYASVTACPAQQSTQWSILPQGFGQSGTMQTYPDGLDLHADHIQSGYHPVKLTPFDYL
jgi:hypothetical protein